jgi:hypothetical protein
MRRPHTPRKSQAPLVVPEVGLFAALLKTETSLSAEVIFFGCFDRKGRFFEVLDGDFFVSLQCAFPQNPEYKWSKPLYFCWILPHFMDPDSQLT